jgi:hypothetical protein
MLSSIYLSLVIIALAAQSTSAKFRVLQPITSAKSYESTDAQFGLPHYGGSITGKLFYGTEGDLDGCTPLHKPGVDTPWAETIAAGQSVVIMVDRGNSCTFVQKVRNGQDAAATAVVVVDNKDEDFLPIMADDGTGNSIHIPSIFISKQSGDELKKLINDKKNVMVQMSWEVPTTDTTVEWEMWITSNDDARNFKKNFKRAAVGLSDRAHLSAHYLFIPGSVFGCTMGTAGQRPCGKQCTNAGRYCAQDPEHDVTKGEDGEDVVAENVRQLCIFKNMEKAKTVTKWWNYIDLFYQNCEPNDSTFNKACSDKQQKAAGIDSSKTDSCVTECGGTGEEDGENHCIEGAMENAGKNGIHILPSIFVNNRLYNGKIDCPTPINIGTCGVLSEICAGFSPGHSPAACDPSYCWEKVDECGVCGGQGVKDECGTCLTAADKNTPKWNAACMGCDKVVNSGNVVDVCGQCGGNGSFDSCGSCFQQGDSRRITDPNLCGGASGGHLATIAVIVSGMMIIMGGTAGYFYIQKREKRMKAEMESVLASYMPLDAANGFAHDGDKSSLINSASL